MAHKQNNVTISRLYQGRMILIDLLKRQGFNVSGYEQFNMALMELMWANNQMDMLLQKQDGEEQLYVRHFLMQSFTVKNITDTICDLCEKTTTLITPRDSILFIVKEEPNDTIRNRLRHVWENEHIFLTVISLERLQFNILEHHLVPKHEIVTDENEVVMIKQRYNVEEDAQFPVLSRFDPVAQAIGLRPGQLCRILRASETAIETEFFRLCS